MNMQNPLNSLWLQDREAAEAKAAAEKAAAEARSKTPTLRPFGDRVLVHVDAPEKEEGGLIVGVSGEEQPRTGTVAAHGDNVEHVSEGMRVRFNRVGGEVIQDEDPEHTYRLFRESELQGEVE